MRKIILFAMLLWAAIATAQTTTVTLQVTDADSQAWNNGTYTVQFVYGAASTAPVIASGSLSGTGGASVVLNSNSTVPGSSMRFKACPAIPGVTCYAKEFYVSGTTQTVTLTPPAIRIPASTLVYGKSVAYADAEITGAIASTEYYNLTLSALRLYSGFSWASVGAGGGSMTWPTSPGIAVCTGTPCTAWGTSIVASTLVPTSRTINTHALSSDLTLAFTDFANQVTLAQLPLSPSVNGLYQLGYNVSGGTPVAPAITFVGVPVDATNPATLLYSDRATFMDWSAGTALALPAVTGNFASNNTFAVKNHSGSTLTITPNVGANDLINGLTSDTILNNWAGFVYQDNTTAPGHWFTIRFPTPSAFPACADSAGNHLNFTSAAGFTCGTTNSTVALNALAAQAADTVVMNNTAGSTTPAAVAMPTCAASGHADVYDPSTHTWTCNSLSGATSTKIMTVASSSLAAPTGTVFWGINGTASGSTLSNSTESSIQTVVGNSGTFTALYVRVSAAEGAAATLQFTLRIAPGGAMGSIASTALTCTIPNSGTTCNITGQSVAFSAGDSMDMQVIQSGTGTSQQMSFSMAWQ